MLEYILNGSPLEANPLIVPTVEASGSDFVFEFTRRAESADDTEQVFQYSTNLSVWNDLNITGIQAPEVNVGPEVDGHEEVTVTIDESLAVEGRLFGRLKASK